MARLEDAVHKLNRGKEQLESLYREFNLAFKRDSLKIGIEKNPYTPTYDSIVPHIAYTIFFERVPEIAKRQAIMTGEVIQSFRIALDYLAWAFAMKHGRIKKSARGSVYLSFGLQERRFRLEIEKSPLQPEP